MLDWNTKQLYVVIVIVFDAIQPSLEQSTDESEGVELMKVLNKEFINAKFKVAEAEWNFVCNITNATASMKTKGQHDYAMFREAKGEDLRHYDFNSFQNESLKRQMKKLANMGDSLLDDESFMFIKSAIDSMQEVYAKTKIPSYQDASIMMSLEPEITEIIKNSRDPEEMKYYWTQWHDKVGTRNKKAFFKYAEIRNEAAQLNSK